MLKGLFQRKLAPAEALYAAIVAAARQQKFYAQWNVPDTVDGRFDMITLHMFAVLNRLREQPGLKISQDLVDVFFADMDSALREMGVGDLTVGKKVRKMAESFYGRLDAYRTTLAQPEPALSQAIARNVFAESPVTHAETLAKWLRKNVEQLASQPIEQIAQGIIAFSE